MINKMEPLKETILVVDDASDTVELISRNLEMHHFPVLTASSVKEAMALLKETEISLVITDYHMPFIGGLDLIRHVRENYPKTEVMMVTGYASVEGAVEAVKAGAEEYLSKPFTEEELLDAVNRTLEKLRLRISEKGGKEEDLCEGYGIIGRSEAILNIINSINKAAGTDAAVLISGEDGTGKELIARAIHYKSSRASAPFVPVSFPGIPEEMLENELFGFVRGRETRKGFFQTADGGTLFLDEISESTIPMQVKLLRALQNKEIKMAGDNKQYKVDIRVIAATNKDMLNLIKKGLFREDLFFRLNIINITVPPLRERGGDITLLAEHFREKFSKDQKITAPGFTREALEALKIYSWPGNIRELENTIQQLVLSSEGKNFDIDDLPAHITGNTKKKTAKTARTLAEVELEHIMEVLESVDGNKNEAAVILGIDLKILTSKLKKKRSSS